MSLGLFYYSSLSLFQRFMDGEMGVNPGYLTTLLLYFVHLSLALMK